MLAVAELHGAKVYSPAQLKPLLDRELDEAGTLLALEKVRAALRLQQSRSGGGPVDRIVKSSAFTDSLLAGEFD